MHAHTVDAITRRTARVLHRRAALHVLAVAVLVRGSRAAGARAADNHPRDGDQHDGGGKDGGKHNGGKDGGGKDSDKKKEDCTKAGRSCERAFDTLCFNSYINNLANAAACAAAFATCCDLEGQCKHGAASSCVITTNAVWHVQ